LAEIVLRDSAEIQMEDAEQKRQRHRKEGRQGKYPETPLYTEADVDRTLPRFRPVAYNTPFDVAPGVMALYRDAGHILGSAMIEVTAREASGDRRLLFSGDIGQWNKPLMHDPSVCTSADYVIMESTYGDRDHEDHGDVATQLADVVNDTAARGGNVVIPTFAVERAQELMFHLGRLQRAKRIPELPVYLDSPMAVDVMEVFRRHREYFDAETWNLINAGEPLLDFRMLRMARTVGESVAIRAASSTTCGTISRGRNQRFSSSAIRGRARWAGKSSTASVKYGFMAECGRCGPRSPRSTAFRPMPTVRRCSSGSATSASRRGGCS
jgi:metallo-beta-lactamase family protein